MLRKLDGLADAHHTFVRVAKVISPAWRAGSARVGIALRYLASIKSRCVAWVPGLAAARWPEFRDVAFVIVKRAVRMAEDLVPEIDRLDGVRRDDETSGIDRKLRTEILAKWGVSRALGHLARNNVDSAERTRPDALKYAEVTGGNSLAAGAGSADIERARPAMAIDQNIFEFHFR